MSYQRVSAAGDLVLEVLAARHRLGEPWWPFDRRHRAALARLADRGLVEVDGDRAQLTDEGRRIYLSPGWVPAPERARADLADDILDSASFTWWFREAKRIGVDPDAMLTVAEAAQVSIRRWGRLLAEDAYPHLPEPLQDGHTSQVPNALREALDKARTVVAMSSNDWSSASDFAALFGLLVGWDCEAPHQHDDTDPDCGFHAQEVADRWGWPAEAVAELRRMRAAIRDAQSP